MFVCLMYIVETSICMYVYLMVKRMKILKNDDLFIRRTYGAYLRKITD